MAKTTKEIMEELRRKSNPTGGSNTTPSASSTPKTQSKSSSVADIMIDLRNKQKEYQKNDPNLITNKLNKAYGDKPWGGIQAASAVITLGNYANMKKQSEEAIPTFTEKMAVSREADKGSVWNGTGEKISDFKENYWYVDKPVIDPSTNRMTTEKVAEKIPDWVKNYKPSTYEQAVSHLEKQGVTDASGIMTEDEWRRRKSSSGVETYSAYLDNVINSKLGKGDSFVENAKRQKERQDEILRLTQEIKGAEKQTGILSTPLSAVIGDKGKVETYLAGKEEELAPKKARLEQLLAEEEQYGNIYDSLAEEADFAELSKPTNKITADLLSNDKADVIYGYINGLPGFEQVYNLVYGEEAGEKFNFVRQNEREIFNYLYNKYGKDYAIEYMETLEDVVNQRQGIDIATGVNNYSELHPILGAGDKLKLSAKQTAEGWVTNAQQIYENVAGTGERVPLTPSQYAYENVRSKTDGLMGAAMDLTSAGVDMLPTIAVSLATAGVGTAAGISTKVASTIGQVAGSATMYGNVYGRSYNQKLREGYSKEEADTYAKIIGGLEGGLSFALSGVSAVGGGGWKVLSKAGSKVLGKPAAAIAKLSGVDKAVSRFATSKFATNSFVRFGVKSFVAGNKEGIEEGLQEILEPVVASMVFNEEYEGADIGDVAYAYFLGAVMGSGFEAPSTISQIQYENSIAKTGEGLKASAFKKWAEENGIEGVTADEINDVLRTEIESSVIKDVIKQGLASEEGSSAYKAAVELQEKYESGKTISAFDLGYTFGEKMREVQTEINAEIEKVNTETEPYVKEYGEYGVSAFRGLVRENPYVSTEEISNSFKTAYEAGHQNVPMEKVQFVNDVQIKAYNAGRMDYIAESTPAEKGYATVYGKEAGFIETNPDDGIDANLKDSLNTLGKALGTKIMFVDTIKTKDGNGANAEYSDGIVRIARDSDKPFIVAAKHEITHHLEKAAPKEYHAYAQYALEIVAKKDGLTASFVIEGYMADGYTESEAYHEVAADFTEYILTDEQALTDFIEDSVKTEEKQKTASAFFNSLHNFVTKVKKAFGGDTEQANEATINAFGATTEQMEKAVRLWKDAAKAAKKYAESHPDGFKAKDGDEKRYSLKEYSQQQKENWKSSKMIVLYENPQQLLEFVNKALNDKQFQKKMYFGVVDEQLADVIRFETGLDFLGRNVTLRADNVRKTKRKHGNDAKERLQGQRGVEASDFAYIPDVISTFDDVVRSEYKGKDAALFSKLIGNDKISVVAVDSGKSSLDLFIQTMYIGVKKDSSITKEGDRAIGGSIANMADVQAPAETPETIVGTAPNGIIQKMGEEVKQNSSNTRHSIKNSAGNLLTEAQSDEAYMSAIDRGDIVSAQKMVDEAAKAAGFTVKALHSTNADFTVFDVSKTSNINFHGQGIYFTNSQKDLETNYENAEGPDSWQKIEGRAYELLQERYDLSYEDTLTSDSEVIGKLNDCYDDAIAEFKKTQRRITAYLKFENPLVLEKGGKGADAYDLAEYDGVIDKQVYENIGHSGMDENTVHYVVFNPKNIKSADPVTFDDNGNVIPLSERFSDDPDIRYSKKGDNVLAEVNKLRQVNAALKEQFKRTNFASVDKQSLDRFAKDLLKHYKSGADINETREALNDLYLYMANGDGKNQPVWEEVLDRARAVAEGVLEGAVVVDDSMYQEYKDLRDYLRSTGMTIDPMYDKDLAGYESINDFRKKNFGRILMVKNGASVDSVYQQLSEMYPQFFDEDVHMTQPDQLNHIAEVLDMLQPTEFNPHSRNMRESINWLADDIIERFYELPQAKPTFADKQHQKLVRKAIEDGHKLEEAVAKERAKREKAVEKIKEHYKAKEARTKERRDASAYKEKIKKHVATISKMLLKGNDKSHVPEVMRNVVGEFLSVLDMTTPRQKEITKDRLNELRSLYTKIAEGKTEIDIEVDPDFFSYVDDVLNALKHGGDVVTISDLNVDELESLYRVVLGVERSIYMHNRLMVEGKNAEIRETANKVATELKTDKAHKVIKNSLVRKLGDTLNMDMLNPQDFFIQLGDTMSGLFQSIRDGFDKKITHLAESKAYMKELAKGVDLNELGGKNAVAKEFTTQGGQKIQLTPAQVMSLYLLQRQPDATRHIYEGGIKAKPVVVRNSETKKMEIIEDSEVVRVTPEDVSNILASMTEEQKKIAEGISKFFTDYTAEWGNEVSLTLYGYKKFTVENYFPIVSDENYLPTVFGETTDATLKNMGSTKARIEGANNPIIIEDVFDVFARQADQMSSYNAFVIPLSDIQRVFNARTENGSVKQSIERAYGKRATQYFKKLMTDINGGARWSGGSQLMNDLISRYKQTKLGLNLRVVLQQPSAFFRAQAVIDSKYLAEALTHQSTADMETIYKYAPIVQWKNWGYFSMDVGKQMKDILLDTKDLSDVTMWAAGKMDELTWKRLWVAAEMEIQDKHSDLKVGSEEYYTEVGKRFSEIIDRTQVVDSVLHRSQMMRNPDTLVKMSVAFMNEPFKAYNMVRTAVTEFRRNPTKATKHAVVSATVGYLSSIVVNHIITAFVDTLRGDDEDEEWLEKMYNKAVGKEGGEPKSWQKRYMWHFFDNVVNEPLSMFPYVKDVVSMIQGYDVKRMDMQGIGDFVNAVKRVSSDKYMPLQKVLDVGTKVADLFGIPASSLKREVSTLSKLIIGVSGSPMMEYQTEKALYNVSANKAKFVDILYKAYKDGDMVVYNKIAQDLIDEGVSPSYIETRLKSNAKKEGTTVADLNGDSFSAGIDLKYETEKTEEEKYTVNSLSGSQYNQFTRSRGQMLDNIVSDYRGLGFGTLSEEAANNLLEAAYKFAENTALESASGGEYDSTTKWINEAQEDVGNGMSYADAILKNKFGYDTDVVDLDTFMVFKEGLKDLEYEKGEYGARKQAVIALLQSMNLTDEEYRYLLRTEYKSR